MKRCSFLCVDCGACTLTNNEYYMVGESTWKQAGLAYDGGMLCIKCLELRLGRPLYGEDFSDCLVNSERKPRSKRLRAAMRRARPS